MSTSETVSGRWYGGPGQQVEITPRPGWPEPIEILMAPDRMVCPAPGLQGGRPGGLSRVLINGEPPAPGSTFYAAGYVTLASDRDVLTWDFAVGGGWGEPAGRDPAALEQDLALGRRSLAWA